MLSINELSTSKKSLEESVSGKDQSLLQINHFKEFSKSHSGSRQLFKKCKQIIQQQLVQIDLLSTKNQSLLDLLKQTEHEKEFLREKMIELESEINQLKSKNQNFQKQKQKSGQVIEELKSKEEQKQKVIQQLNNRNIQMQSSYEKLKILNETSKQKCLLLETSMDLMRQQNDRLNQELNKQEQKMIIEIESLRKFKKLLEIKETQTLLNQKLTLDFSARKQHFAEFQKQKSRSKYLPFGSPFHSIQLHRDPDSAETFSKKKEVKRQRNQNHMEMVKRKPVINQSMNSVSYFSIVDENLPGSRIRKNYSKPKILTDSDFTNEFRQISKLKTNLKKTPKKNQVKTQAHSLNPEIQSELSDMKKKIVKQYGMIELKKQMINQVVISKTLQEIENKLQKMARISAIDPTQSQFD